ncbi:hypothetical protein VTI74DRAFT_5368 [Chaetomium olivicolor]
MGNLCSSESDPFSKPGHRLDSAPAAPTTASVPSSAHSGTSKKRQQQPPTPKVGGPPRTLGGGSGSTPSSSANGDDARRRAAEAAEARAQKSKQGAGKLKTKLDQQKGMTDAGVLKQASETERRQRELDENAAALRNS